MQKAEVFGDPFVEDAERVRQVDLAQAAEVGALAHPVARGCFLSPAIEAEHGCPGKRRGVESAGRMAQMVRHEMPAVRPIDSGAAKAGLEMVGGAVCELPGGIGD